MEEIQKNMCRLCLQISSDMKNIFNIEENYIKMIEKLTEIEFTIVNDELQGLPMNICSECLTTSQMVYDFKETCLKSDEWLKEIYNEIYKLENSTDFKNKNNLRNGTKELPHILKENGKFEEKYDPSIEGNVTILSGCILENENKNELENKCSNRQEKNKIKKRNGVKQEYSDRKDKKKLNTDEPKKKKKYPERKVPCHMCGKFYTPYHMQAHMNVHNGVRPFPCQFPSCDKTFASVILQKRHFRMCHTNYAPYECDICGHKSKNKGKYDFHRSYHFEPQLPCSICGKRLRNTKALKKHSMSHTGERPFSCETCQKEFQTRYSLKVHQRVHTKEKPYKCSKCDKSFAYKCLLKSHTQKHHMENFLNEKI